MGKRRNGSRIDTWLFWRYMDMERRPPMPRWIWAAILVAAWALVFFGGWPVAVGLWVHVLLVAAVLVVFWPWVRAPNVPAAPRR